MADIKIKLARGRKLRKVSLRRIVEIGNTPFDRHAAGAITAIDENNEHFVAMSVKSINILKKTIAKNKIFHGNPAAIDFAECDTCPPWED